VDLVCNFIAETFSLILFILIGIRTIELDSDSKYYVTVFTVLTIWLTEVSICIRFALNLRENAEKVNVFVTTNDVGMKNDNDKIFNYKGKGDLDDTAYVDQKVNVFYDKGNKGIQKIDMKRNWNNAKVAAEETNKKEVSDLTSGNRFVPRNNRPNRVADGNRSPSKNTQARNNFMN
jgi:hypothetical protein